MKKILTFLVMLLCGVSMLMAQEPTKRPVEVIDQPAVKAMFPFQAVVRDMTNERNLVVNDTVKIVVKIYGLIDNEILYTETFEKVPTNFNGLVSIVIGKNEQTPKALSQINWKNTPVISATFYKGGEEISTVETPVMAVPYALQADNAPVELTTEEIVRYLSDPTTNAASVDAIVNALVNNGPVSQRVKDTIIGYIKTQKPVVKDLAFYFLGLAEPQDLYDALDHTPAAVKQAVKDTVINYIKNHKDEAMDILASYLGQVTKDDVVEMMDAARNNPQAELILDTLVKYTFNYVVSKPALMQKAYEKIVDNISATQFEAALTYIHQNRQDVYDFIVNKFYAHLQAYLDQNKYLKNCAENPLRTGPGANDPVATDICYLLTRIQALENSVNPSTPEVEPTCPEIETVSVNIISEGNNSYVVVTVTVSNFDATNDQLDCELTTMVPSTVPLFNTPAIRSNPAANTYVFSYQLTGESIDGVIFQATATVHKVDSADCPNESSDTGQYPN